MGQYTKRLNVGPRFQSSESHSAKDHVSASHRPAVADGGCKSQSVCRPGQMDRHHGSVDQVRGRNSNDGTLKEKVLLLTPYFKREQNK